jgi:hypothetical protein
VLLALIVGEVTFAHTADHAVVGRCIANSLPIANSAVDSRAFLPGAVGAVMIFVALTKARSCVARAMIVANEASGRIRAMPHATVETKEIRVAFAYELLASLLAHTVPLPAASCLHKLVVTIAHWAGALIARRSIIGWVALAFPYLEIANTTHFMWPAVQLVV